MMKLLGWDGSVMSKEVSVAEILDMDDMVVSTQGYTRKQLSDAFDKIADPSNWKMPILKLIHKDEFDISNEACIFFTGSPLNDAGIDENDCMLVSAAGYYNTIGG